MNQNGTNLHFLPDLVSDFTFFKKCVFFNPLIFRNAYGDQINQEYEDLIKDTDQSFVKLVEMEIIAAHRISKNPIRQSLF